MRYESAPVAPEERQETTRERAARQRRERQEELRDTASDEKRWKENRERVLRDRQEAGLGQISQGFKTPIVLSESTAPLQTVESNITDVNPSNMHWPPYNFLAKEGEKEIHVRYTQDVVETTVLAPEEWKEFFDALDKTQNIGGAMKGTYDAFDTAKQLGGLGVMAYVKTHNGVDYLILKGYKQHMKTLLAGHRFKASNPQVVKLSLGALDSVKGMARYVKVTAPMEILVGSAINVLQYVLNDEYTLKQLGIDEAKLLVNVLAVAGTALVIGTVVAPTTILATGVILVLSSLLVWGADQKTQFESKLVESVLGTFDEN
ncbi:MULTISPECIES: hypothetical protein [Vibrio]|uniref:hypothetical protein n=1 Tax=Vibrio TaxID=662 RepID=UPI001F10F305|nr:hypothetical protein [Vibrio sp. F12]